ncbi:MAG: alanine racemase, partial [Gammaproteobacteria bacterium]
NGYGHGLVAVAEALHAADGFGVARLEEALVLREAGIGKPVTLLEGFMDAAELEAAGRLGLEVVLHSDYQLALLESAHVQASLRVWVKLDTGMHRLGFDPERLEAVIRRLRALPLVQQPPGCLSHLACADERANPATEDQHRRFEGALNDYPGERSLANSAGLLGWPDLHYDWVRPGIMLYGVSPFADALGPGLGLRPAMTLETRIIGIRELRKGDAIGYGGSWVCPEDMCVGVAAIGYGDGYPRHAAAGTPVLIQGRRVTLVGRVSMDMITLDLRGHDAVREGDRVVLWGEGLPVEEVAAAADTIGYELLTGITGRVQLEYD